MLSSCCSVCKPFRSDNTSEGEGSLQFSCLVSHHALRTRKVHVIFLSFRVQILQIDNTSEEEGSLQCSCLVSHQWRFKNEKGPCYAFLVMSYCVTRTYLKDFTTWFLLSRIDFWFWKYESTRIDSIRVDSSKFFTSLRIYSRPDFR